MRKSMWQQAAEAERQPLPPIPGVTLIGIGNKARQGKGVAAGVMTTRWPKLFKEYAFADALKAYCRVIEGMREKDGPLLQRIGHGRRQSWPDCWLEALYWRIDEDRPPFAVIADVRYPNEAQLIKRTGGLMILIRRERPDGTPWIADDRDPTHPSENLLDDYPWDYTLVNRDLSQFTADVEDLVLMHVIP